MIEQSVIIGRKTVLAIKHKGRKNSYINTINTNDPTYLKQLYQCTTTLHGDAAIYRNLANPMNTKANSVNIIPGKMKPLHLLVGQLKQ
jgi:hypothetical protein